MTPNGDIIGVLTAALLCAAWPSALRGQTPTALQCYYDDSGQLYRILDGSGNLIEYVYDPIGNILQIKRSTLAANVLGILNVTPAIMAIGTTFTILGQGFSPTATSNIVTIGGAQVTVLSATTNSLRVLVPANAASGSVNLTVGGISTSWSGNAVILPPSPAITAISPIGALAGTIISTLTLTGRNLTGSTFSFVGPSWNLVSITSASIAASGKSATLTVAINAAAFGRFVLVASNSAGASSIAGVRGNTLVVPGSNPSADPDLDGLPNAQEIALTTDPLINDTDADGFGDGDEVAAGTDPLDPSSYPHLSATLPPLAQSVAVSVFNATPQIANPQTAPPTEANGLPVSVYNSKPQIPNPQTAPPSEAQSLTVSVKNGTVTTLLELQALLRQIDSDGDGLPDVVEIALCGTSFCAKPDDDNDGDGLTNLQEVRLGTNPKNPDTDGDGLSDGDEISRYHTDPLNPDTDGDGYTDGEEISAGTNPLDPGSVPPYPPRARSEPTRPQALAPSPRKRFETATLAGDTTEGVTHARHD